MTGDSTRWSLIVRDGSGWITEYSASSPSLNRWYSVELRWVQSSSNGLAELYVDGVRVVSASGRNTNSFGGAQSVDFGLAELYNVASTRVYGDCFVASRSYIGPESVTVHDLSISISGSGSTSPGPGTYQFEEGTVVSVQASPSSGWSLSRWELDGQPVGSANPYDVTMNADHSLRAVFQEDVVEIFDDDFESGNFGAWSGTSTSSGESASVSSGLPHHGSYSGLFTSNGGGGFERAYSYVNVPTSSELYARGYFRVTQSGIYQNDDRFYFLRFMSGGYNLAYAGWKMVGGSVRWSLILRDGSIWINEESTSSPNINQWYSVELHWIEDSSNGGAELYVNGQLMISSMGRNTAALGSIEEIRFGLAELYNCASTRVYGDCFVVSDSYVGTE
jgi:hypothetical protein